MISPLDEINNYPLLCSKLSMVFFPKYLEDLFVNCDSRYNLRDRDNKLTLPLPKTNYGKSSFQYCGAKIWNNLPNEVLNLNSLATFRKKNSFSFIRPTRQSWKPVSVNVLLFYHSFSLDFDKTKALLNLSMHFSKIAYHKVYFDKI